MQKKILTFIVHGKKILALYSESHPQHGEGGWFVVTGAIENNESSKDAVRREGGRNGQLVSVFCIPLLIFR